MYRNVKPLSSRWASMLVVLSVSVVASGGELPMLSPIDFRAVQLENGFWKPRLAVLRERTLPHELAWCEKTGRLANFDIAAGRAEGQHQGYFFNDSDVYKVLEGAAYLIEFFPEDRELRELADGLIERIAAAQQEDGYLNTYFQVAQPGQRWTDDRYHELYCAGHLIEAATAHFQATGQRRLLDVAVRLANHIDSVFGPGRRLEAPEHPEIELALLKLWRVTGEKRYLDLAGFFVEQRGQPRGREGWGEYAQDHLPIRQQREVVGHAVRAMYLLAAATELAALTGDQELAAALDALWEDLTSRKMYVTGGIGVVGHSEGFATGYDLPNERAYAETCASIGLALWSARMSRLHRDARYMDVFERAVYNGVLSGISLTGDRFLYVNPLASSGVATFRTGGGKQGESRSHRQEWFKCACCPPNLLRFIPTIGGYAYAHAGDELYVNLLLASRTKVRLQSGEVEVTQETDYPWDGKVHIRVEPQSPFTFELYVRVPGWCAGARLSLNGRPVSPPELRRGYARLSRTWQPGDVVDLELPMPVVRVECHPLVEANRGRIALQRGPLVYCLEQADNPDGVLDLAIPRSAVLSVERRPDLLGGITVISGPALRQSALPWNQRLYRPAGDWPPPEPTRFVAIPYYAWDNRTPGEMAVWIPEDPRLTRPTPSTGP